MKSLWIWSDDLLLPKSYFCLSIIFMQALGFYLILPFLYLISLLPFPVFYLFSDFVFVLVYYIIGYRKKVVEQNLKNSFPEKTEQEIALLQKKFYRYFCDMSLEVLKTLTIGKASMLKHCHLDEPSVQLINNVLKERKKALFVLGHLGNWEWAGNAFSLQCKDPMYVVYHPLENKYFNRMVLGMRTRFGTRLIEMKNTFRELVKMKEEVHVAAFIADQTPSPDNAFWVRFLNQDTPVFKGTEVIARKLNYPIIFINIQKVKRGYYEITAEMLCEHPSATADGEITEMHTRKLETKIKSSPETWLWSHRRWKHKRA